MDYKGFYYKFSQIILANCSHTHPIVCLLSLSVSQTATELQVFLHKSPQNAKLHTQTGSNMKPCRHVTVYTCVCQTLVLFHHSLQVLHTNFISARELSGSESHKSCGSHGDPNKQLHLFTLLTQLKHQGVAYRVLNWWV